MLSQNGLELYLNKEETSDLDVVMSHMGCVGGSLKAGVARSGSYHTFFSAKSIGGRTRRLGCQGLQVHLGQLG